MREATVPQEDVHDYRDEAPKSEEETVRRSSFLRDRRHDPSRQGCTRGPWRADTRDAMDAADDLHGRAFPGSPALRRLRAPDGRLDGPSARSGLEQELGCDLAELLVAALAPASRRRRSALSLCA